MKTLIPLFKAEIITKEDNKILMVTKEDIIINMEIIVETESVISMLLVYISMLYLNKPL